ncbi:MAG: hypothetical protein PUC73_12170 [Lachnospiraceae bacterium]|nr:hypothetical protein [Lachnospiraceae bacterium]
MKKRFLAITTISVLLLSSFTACSKSKDEKDTTPDATPTATASVSNDSSADEELTLDTENAEIETISLGGTFSRANGGLSFFITEKGWEVSGYHFLADVTSSAGPVILSGTTTMGDGPVFLYSDEENEVSFTFSADSVTVAVTKGTAYQIFEGSFSRVAETEPQPEILSPKEGSSLELLGRVALTHYMLKAEGIPECMINLSEISFDNATMEKFLLTYTNLFLSTRASFFPEIADGIFCTITKDELNELFLTASAGAFDASAFDGTAADIVLKENTYYVPCNGTFAGGLTVETLDQALVSDALTICGVVGKADGTRYTVEMTLSTSEDVSSATGVRIDTVTYTLAQ